MPHEGLCHVKDKIGNGGQCSTSYMNISIYLELLKTNFNLGKFQIHSVKPLADPEKEVIRSTGIAEQTIDQGSPFRRAERGDIDLIAVEDPAADAGEGGEALEGGPAKGLLLLVLTASSEGAGPGEDRLASVPHTLAWKSSVEGDGKAEAGMGREGKGINTRNK